MMLKMCGRKTAFPTSSVIRYIIFIYVFSLFIIMHEQSERSAMQLIYLGGTSRLLTAHNHFSCKPSHRSKETHCIWGFRAHQHQRSLAPIMNDFFMIMMADDNQGWMGPVFPMFVLQLRKTPKNTSIRKKRPDWGSNPGLLGERHRCYPLTTAVVLMRSF